MSKTATQKVEQKDEFKVPQIQKREKEDDLAVAIRVAKERNLNKEDTEFFANAAFDTKDKIFPLILDAICSLSLVKATFKDEDLLSLEGYEFDATKEVINKVFNLLETVVDLHCATT